MKFIITAGVTRTAEIGGISAAGASPEAMVQTPSADLEIVRHGQPVRTSVVPVSPSGCPTPAVVTRAVSELLSLDIRYVDAGLVHPTDVLTVEVGTTPGADIRRPEALPAAASVFQTARTFAASLPDDKLVLAETIPGGTTTALGVLTALGEQPVVSSSLPTNPLARKRALVDEGLDASGLEPGGANGEPITALRAVGDPVLAAVAGMIVGATEADTDVLLAGGTQMGAAAALARHAGIETVLSLATTSFVAADERADIEAHAVDLGLELTVTDPNFEEDSHVAFERYLAGEGKEGVGMGGALALAEQSGVPLTRVRERVVSVYERIVAPSRQEQT